VNWSRNFCYSGIARRKSRFAGLKRRKDPRTDGSFKRAAFRFCAYKV